MCVYFRGEEQTLEDILEARDMRVRYQEYLTDKYHSAIVSYKLNIPGPIKYSSLIKRIFDEGLAVFNKKINEASINLVHEKVWYKNSGPEFFAVIDMEAGLIKKLTSFIEENHALGRLYDFDVINTDGTQVSRKELGIGQRKCLLCDNDAFECGRSRRHDIDTLIAKIENMALNYFEETWRL